MNNKPCVSIIIPVYNAEEYLRQCLDSVVNQTLDNYEVVIVNDGSKDGSDSILKEYAKKYPYINLIEQENSGVIAARIKGYENAVGEYIGWVDADDFCELNMDASDATASDKTLTQAYTAVICIADRSVTAFPESE